LWIEFNCSSEIFDSFDKAVCFGQPNSWIKQTQNQNGYSRGVHKSRVDFGFETILFLFKTKSQPIKEGFDPKLRNSRFFEPLDYI
jgi:hypothetical protein